MKIWNQMNGKKQGKWKLLEGGRGSVKHLEKKKRRIPGTLVVEKGLRRDKGA